ncbi:MAG: hypothetical protein V2A70_00750 [Candidatus Omnitrophota bacterium]
MLNSSQNLKEKELEQRKRMHALASDGGLVRVAKRVLESKGIVPPDAPMLVGIIIEGTERLQTLPPERVAAIRNLGFLAMDKKRTSDTKNESEDGVPKTTRARHFYHDQTIDPNLNI